MEKNLIQKQGGQMSAAKAEKKTMQAYIKAMEPAIKKALPSVITPERFTRMVLSALSSTPKLAECSPQSFLAAMMTAAQLGVNAYGIYVVDVVSGGPADKAGLKAGDRIVSIDNTEVAQKTDLGTLMQEHSAGDTLSITVARDGQMQTVSLTLGEKNAQTQQAQKNS